MPSRHSPSTNTLCQSSSATTVPPSRPAQKALSAARSAASNTMIWRLIFMQCSSGLQGTTLRANPPYRLLGARAITHPPPLQKWDTRCRHEAPGSRTYVQLSIRDLKRMCQADAYHFTKGDHAAGRYQHLTLPMHAGVQID